jgi:hypothetical protein
MRDTSRRLSVRHVDDTPLDSDTSLHSLFSFPHDRMPFFSSRWDRLLNFFVYDFVF